RFDAGLEVMWSAPAVPALSTAAAWPPHSRSPDFFSYTRRFPDDSTSKETLMKPEIHPKYQDVPVHCACGETWTTRSTRKELRIEICSKCHPFFTGKQKLVDSAGRIDRFQQRYAKRQQPTVGTKSGAKK